MNKRKGYSNGATTLSIKPPPIKPSVVESEVIVPVLWAVLLAGSLGLVATLATLALREILGADWPWWLPLVAGGCLGVVVFAWRCTVAEGDRRALLLWPIEAALGQDLDQDGWIGEPVTEVEVDPPPPNSKLIYVHSPYKAQHDKDAGDFRYFLRGAYGEKGTTWRAWDNASLPSGKVVVRPTWDMWCGRLVKAGLAARPYKSSPLQLGGDYRQALDTLRSCL